MNKCVLGIKDFNVFITAYNCNTLIYFPPKFSLKFIYYCASYREDMPQSIAMLIAC